MTNAFDSVCTYVRDNKGKPLERAQLLRLLESALSLTLVRSGLFPIHLRSDRNGSDESALEIDAAAFSCSDGISPAAEVWNRQLVDPLLATARWLSGNAGPRRIGLRGSYRLSTGLALGWAFRAATGFELEIPTRSGPWPTDDHPDRSSEVALEVRHADAVDGTDLVVSVGVLRRPAETLTRAGLDVSKILDLFIKEPITSPKHAQWAVAQVKAAISANVERLRPQRVRLYLAGPAALAVALGHRWNAMPPTQLHEFRSEGVYAPTALLA